MRCNEKNEWYCFNREYKPLGFNQAHMQYKFVDYPIFTPYRGMTDQKLIEIAGNESKVDRDEKGIIQAIWFYDDGSNPSVIEVPAPGVEHDHPACLGPIFLQRLLQILPTFRNVEELIKKTEAPTMHRSLARTTASCIASRIPATSTAARISST